ncbi:MAG TPA: hypothetical protein VLM37_10600, partial [Fibrobacteraceae bacterium]|nr:hypothetical protein [Fibrobacteraceae bacterium]
TVERKVKVKATLQQLKLGMLSAEVGRLPQLVCVEQIRAIGEAAMFLLRKERSDTLESAVAPGCFALSCPDSSDLAEARPLELGAAILRLAESEK